MIIYAKGESQFCNYIISSEPIDGLLEIDEKSWESAQINGGYIKKGKFIIAPSKPTGKNKFDFDKETWIFDQAIADAEYKASIPNAVTMRQARRAMFDAGIYEKVDAAIKQAGGTALIDWEYSNTFDRSNPMIESMAAQLNLTDKQVDELFIAASKVTLP